MAKNVFITPGERFGKLVAVYEVRVNSFYVWHCLCDCGNEVTTRKYNLRDGSTTSCGCSLYLPNRLDRAIEASLASRILRRSSVLGKRFGRLLVTEDGDSAFLSCTCDCGELLEIQRSRVTGGKVRSCGCLRRDVHSKMMIDRAKAYRISIGLSGEDLIRPRNSGEYNKLAWSIRKRDRYRCVLCNCSEKLHVHHIESWLQFPEKRLDSLNLVSLCPSCHIEKAHAGNTKKSPDAEIAFILKQYIVETYAGGEVEKNANLELTDDERLLILSGIKPERIARNWSDLSLEELVEIVNKSRNTKGDN